MARAATSRSRKKKTTEAGGATDNAKGDEVVVNGSPGKAPSASKAEDPASREEPVVPATKSRKRRQPESTSTAGRTSKRIKLEFPSKDEVGEVLTLGQGDTGQLGLGEDIMERSKPALVKNIKDAVDIRAGGMHTVCLTKDGKVFTFGCNDEGSLGRQTDEDEECYQPGSVDLPGKVVQISAGDSHTVALLEDGKTFYWGTFRDSSGSFGLTPTGNIEKLPVPLAHNLHVVKIASGSDHVALLTEDGNIYTVGCGEQGQLGRVGERFVARGGRRGLKLLLEPDRVHTKNRKTVFTNVWAGSYGTYALTSNGEVMVCGLNNYHQLGVDRGQLFFVMTKSESFSNMAKDRGLAAIAPGQHHTLAVDNTGQVYAIGRVEYGRLGLGTDAKDDAIQPTAVTGIKDVVDISCGTAVSFAVRRDGEALSWGMGTNGQLGHAEDDDAWSPSKMIGKQLETRRVLLASGGGQHTVLLARGN